MIKDWLQSVSCLSSTSLSWAIASVVQVWESPWSMRSSSAFLSSRTTSSSLLCPGRTWWFWSRFWSVGAWTSRWWFQWRNPRLSRLQDITCGGSSTCSMTAMRLWSWRVSSGTWVSCRGLVLQPLSPATPVLNLPRLSSLNGIFSNFAALSRTR